MLSKGILIIDDDEDIRVQLKAALEAEGYSVHAEANGKTALDYLTGLNPDHLPCCIILDLMMPEMTGAQFLDIIANSYKESLGKIRIIIASAKGSPVKPGTISPNAQTVSKPFDLDELYSVLEKHCI